MCSLELWMIITEMEKLEFIMTQRELAALGR